MKKPPRNKQHDARAASGFRSPFERALKFVMAHEIARDRDGNVTWEKVPGDRGGVTKYGIDSRSHPNLDIKNLSYEDAASTYYEEYWTPICGPQLPEALAIATFDIAVLQGVGAAKKLLQKALGVKVDGVIGPRTLAAAEKSGAEELRKLLALREQGLRRISAQPLQKKFLKGWLARNGALTQEVAA